MANEEHLSLSQYLKDTHLLLRKSAQSKGAEDAWKEHVTNKEVLKTYAQTMEKLATTHWQNNCDNDTSDAISRIDWAADFIHEYFIKEKWKEYLDKEKLIGTKINITIEYTNNISQPIKLLDVGSCYNPFKQYKYLDVLAIDLYPANNSVFECDFLSVPTGFNTVIDNSLIKELKEDYFDVITFCFLLEYIPSSDLRIKACEKAYLLLKPGGLLIISTPDSKHVGANSKQMKCWRYTLALIGFNRIKYEKHRHMHCMVFRKSLHKNIANRWADLHKEPFMSYAINIPQDSKVYNQQDHVQENINIELSLDDFKDMPFFDD